MKVRIIHINQENKGNQYILENLFFNTGDFFHIARTTISSKNDLAIHYHNYTEAFWINDCEGVHIINDSELPLQSGSLTMIRPSDNHSLKMTSSKSKLLITNIAFFQSSLDYFKKMYFRDRNCKKYGGYPIYV